MRRFIRPPTWLRHPLTHGLTRMVPLYVALTLAISLFTGTNPGPSMVRGVGLLLAATAGLSLAFALPSSWRQVAAVVATFIVGMAVFQYHAGTGVLAALGMGVAAAVLLIGIPAAWRHLWARWRSGRAGTR